MPMYEYCCKDCGNFEVIEKFDSKKTKPCPECGKTCKRIIANTSPPKFSGSGFYETDYKKRRK